MLSHRDWLTLVGKTWWDLSYLEKPTEFIIALMWQCNFAPYHSWFRPVEDENAIEANHVKFVFITAIFKNFWECTNSHAFQEFSVAVVADTVSFHIGHCFCTTALHSLHCLPWHSSTHYTLGLWDTVCSSAESAPRTFTIFVKWGLDKLFNCLPCIL